jgi:regulator of protease activity HflC (stomatin/prohibitin superfamily)
VLAIVIIALVLIRFSIRAVPQGEEWIIERLGRYHRTLKPGLAFIMPLIDYIRNKVNVREQFLDVPSQAVITKDNAIVQIDAVFFYRVVDSYNATYNITNIDASLIQLAKTNLRAIIGSMELEHALSNRDEINAKLRNNLSGIESEWGIVITRVEIRDILPPETIVKAMEKQIQADREKRAIILQAEANREKQRLESEGYLIAQTNRAEAIKRVGQAQADVIAMIGQSLKESGETAGLLQLGERYIEAIKDLASSNSSKLIILPNSIIDAVKGLIDK